MRKILQITSESGKTIRIFGAECIHSLHDGSYYAEAWDTDGKEVAMTRTYRNAETAWKNLKACLARKYAED